MLEPVPDTPDREEWDEYDWELFLRRADTRAAKYQELFETFARRPDRDQLIAREMGWEESLQHCSGTDRDCPHCDVRFECEAYEMFLLTEEPEELEDDPETDDLIACFEQLRDIPAYSRATEFAGRVEDLLRKCPARPDPDESLRAAMLAAQLVPAQVAGGHGIGYDRDALCGNIANCKRSLRSLATCLEHLRELALRRVLAPQEVERFRAEAEAVATEINRWIESLRARIWWR